MFVSRRLRAGAVTGAGGRRRDPPALASIVQFRGTLRQLALPHHEQGFRPIPPRPLTRALNGVEGAGQLVGHATGSGVNPYMVMWPVRLHGANCKRDVEDYQRGRSVDNLQRARSRAIIPANATIGRLQVADPPGVGPALPLNTPKPFTTGEQCADLRDGQPGSGARSRRKCRLGLVLDAGDLRRPGRARRAPGSVVVTIVHEKGRLLDRAGADWIEDERSRIGG